MIHIVNGAPPSLKPVRVLIADDSPAFVQALADFLKRMRGLAVVATARNGREALEQAARHNPDLAILDVSMPELSGLATAAELRNRSPQLRIIVVSIRQDPLLRADSLKHGADIFLSKIGLHRRLRLEIERLFPQLNHSVVAIHSEGLS